MERQKFENAWRDAFTGAEQSPSENVWSAIDSKLTVAEGGTMKRRVVFYQRLAAASILFAVVFGSLTAYYINENNSQIGDGRLAEKTFNYDQLVNDQLADSKVVEDQLTNDKSVNDQLINNKSEENQITNDQLSNTQLANDNKNVARNSTKGNEQTEK